MTLTNETYLRLLQKKGKSIFLKQYIYIYTDETLECNNKYEIVQVNIENGRFKSQHR